MKKIMLIAFILLIGCSNNETANITVLYGEGKNVSRLSQCSVNGFTIEFIDNVYYVIYLDGSPATTNPFSSPEAAKKHIIKLAGRHNDLWIKSNGEKYYDNTFFKDGR